MPRITDKSTHSVTPSLFHLLGDHHLREFELQAPDGRGQKHLITSPRKIRETPELLDQTIDLLAMFGGVLDETPKRVIPSFEMPSHGDARIASFLRWIYCLHFLGSLDNCLAFSTHVEYSISLSSYGGDSPLTRWAPNLFHSAFNPIEYVTFSEEKMRSEQEWSRLHEKEGKLFPAYIASSLSRPLLLASIMAVDFLVYKADGRKDIPKPRSRYTYRLAKSEFDEADEQPTVQVDQRMLGLVKILIDHHSRGKTTVRTCLTASDIMERLNPQCSQPTLSRLMKELMKQLDVSREVRGMAAYRRFCRQEGFEEKLWRKWVELAKANPAEPKQRSRQRKVTAGKSKK